MKKGTGGIFQVLYNRPSKSNAFDPAVSRALVTLLEFLHQDVDCDAIVITGRGQYFCSAAKFDEMLWPAHPAKLYESTSAGNFQLFNSFLDLGKPILAAVNGPAFGGGVTQATLCDATISVSSAKYSIPFLLWRVSPEGCSSVHLARVVGRRAARDLFDGWTPGSEAAYSVAMVSQVVSP